MITENKIMNIPGSVSMSESIEILSLLPKCPTGTDEKNLRVLQRKICTIYVGTIGCDIKPKSDQD